MLLVGEEQYEIGPRQDFIHRVAQKLANSLPTSHPMGSCRGLPCNSPLATPEIQGFPIERPIRGIPGNSFWGSQRGFWDDFLWR